MITCFPTEILERLRTAQVVAGFSVEKVEFAVPVAEALLAGGIDVIELTLRTDAGIEAVKAISAEVPEMLVGVGTILTPEQAAEAKAAGADFGVSPGLNPRVVNEANAIGLPFAPGISTPTELEAAIELGCRFVKFFPAEAAGGIQYLKSMGAPYKHLGIEYFPLGGLNAENMVQYLSEPNVAAIGGSWIVQESLVAENNWAAIASRAAEVRSLLEGSSSVQREVLANPA
ncbi:bifunctional 4-hydroxy-2-oxoglutarate aldolase/2-dehydro-3-deoxy-phosphogluconate aldolase [Adhaeretor mobilis]|uniref:2-dehydro-3-deoxy-phosphogluconate aldolase n=1 Tax=Adhaeretor mobilis TaxID=1930276 RepID=A0A517MUD8_9BACT|nr:bifunctional 4-hydroxy-2-oxoglutarate aldolase/2-dehydro-3-deoxy-phosphogluconate aldolase [Adhaeretor mobilis]QDS98498.1 Putative KHG/KDPG aldolase [Adhaeretor mobilis]